MLFLKKYPIIPIYLPNITIHINWIIYQYPYIIPTSTDMESHGIPWICVDEHGRKCWEFPYIKWRLKINVKVEHSPIIYIYICIHIYILTCMNPFLVKLLLESGGTGWHLYRTTGCAPLTGFSEKPAPLVAPRVAFWLWKTQLWKINMFSLFGYFQV